MLIRFTYGLLVLGAFWSFSLRAQTVPLEDLNFLSYLQSNLPEVLVADELDTVASENLVLRTLDVQNQNITIAHELHFFKQIDSLVIANNQLDSVGDYGRISNLSYVDCSNNQLRFLPSVYQNLSLTHYLCGNNRCERVPWIGSLESTLTHFDVSNNQLTHLHDFTDFTSLQEWNVSGNKLTFSWLLQNVGIPDFENVAIISPQQPLEVPEAQTLDAGDTLVFDLANESDDTVTSNTYHWYLDGELVRETNYDSIHVFPLNFSHAGDWHVEVTNSHPLLISLTLVSENMQVSITNCLDLNDLEWTQGPVNCLQHAPISLDYSQLMGNAPYEVSLINSINLDTLTIQETTDIPVGIYDIAIMDNDGCEGRADDFILVEGTSNCDALLTPDGDGVDDSFYIDQEGAIRFIDKNGKLLTEIQGPILWDGRKANGELLPPGYYLMYADDMKIGSVTLSW